MTRMKDWLKRQFSRMHCVYSKLGLPLLLTFFLNALSQEMPVVAISAILLKSISPEQYLAYNTFAFLPWSFRLVFALVSDSLPILWYRRKPYMAACFLGNCLIYITYGITAASKLSFWQAVLFAVMLSVGHCWIEVCLDGLAVEKGYVAATHADDDSDNGEADEYTDLDLDTTMQSHVQGMTMQIKSLGSFTSACIALLLSLFCSSSTIIICAAAVPLTGAVISFFLPDTKCRNTSVDSGDDIEVLSREGLPVLRAAWIIWKLRRKIVVLLCKKTGPLYPLWRSVLPSILFVCMYNLMPTGADVWWSYLAGVMRQFSVSQLHAFNVVGLIASWMGAFLYQVCFATFPLRPMCIVTSVLAAVVMSGRIILAQGWNQSVLHFSDVTYTFLITIFVNAATRIAFMPTLSLAAESCSPGLEATMFSLFGSVAHFSALGANGISASWASSFGISRTNYDHLWLHLLLSSLCKLLPLFLLPLVPQRPTHVNTPALSQLAVTIDNPLDAVSGECEEGRLFTALLETRENDGLQEQAVGSGSGAGSPRSSNGEGEAYYPL